MCVSMHMCMSKTCKFSSVCVCVCEIRNPIWAMKFLGFFVFVLVILFEAKAGFGQGHIIWDDLLLNHGSHGRERVIVVDKNGRGDAKTVQGAVNKVPDHNNQRVKIHVYPGIYSEKVFVSKSKPYISFIGDVNHPESTVITWHDKASDKDRHGHVIGTVNSATVTVESDYFCASGITFQNTVKPPGKGSPGYQALALSIRGDKAVFYKTRLVGSQDTLMDQLGRHYFYQSYIQGSVDFIFGYGKSLYQGCKIRLAEQTYSIAAQGRSSPNEDSGFSFVNCTLEGTGPVFLGRAWKQYSRVVYSYCKFNVDIFPQGWDDNGDPSCHQRVVFGEFKNRGKGADRSKRVPWSKELDYGEAKACMDKSFIEGESWLKL